MWLALLALLYGCCTDMGCIGQLRVIVSGIPDGTPVVVEVREGGTSYTCTWEAAGEGLCEGGGGVLEGDTVEFVVGDPQADGPIDVTVRVSDAVALDTTIEPEWTDFAPNGPGCGPVCSGATVELSAD